jgi:hypothetical protein
MTFGFMHCIYDAINIIILSCRYTAVFLIIRKQFRAYNFFVD